MNKKRFKPFNSFESGERFQVYFKHEYSSCIMIDFVKSGWSVYFTVDYKDYSWLGIAFCKYYYCTECNNSNDIYERFFNDYD